MSKQKNTYQTKNKVYRTPTQREVLQKQTDISQRPIQLGHHAISIIYNDNKSLSSTQFVIFTPNSASNKRAFPFVNSTPKTK